MRDNDEEIKDLESYLHKMGQDDEWGGGPMCMRQHGFTRWI
jgi:hypothetical protein